MTRQQARSHCLNSIAGAATAWLGIFILLGNLDRTVPKLSNLLCGAGLQGLRVLPSIALAVWQAMPEHGFEHHGLLQCLLQMLLSFWPLLLGTAGAI
jgi:hypothetical protein